MKQLKPSLALLLIIVVAIEISFLYDIYRTYGFSIISVIWTALAIVQAYLYFLTYFNKK